MSNYDDILNGKLDSGGAANLVDKLEAEALEMKEALRLARSYIGSLSGKEVPGMKGLAAVMVLFKIDKALEKS